MTWRSKLYFKLLVASLFLAVIASYNCIPVDEPCDDDPVYGGCHSSCEFRGDFWNIAGKTFGFYIVMAVGMYFVTNDFKKQLESEVKEKLDEIRKKRITKTEEVIAETEWRVIDAIRDLG